MIATYHNRLGPTFPSSGQTIATFQHNILQHCWAQRDTLGIENRTSAHVREQHCCRNLAKRLQHHATSTNLSHHHLSCRSTLQHLSTGWPDARSKLRPTMLRWNVAKVWPGLYANHACAAMACHNNAPVARAHIGFELHPIFLGVLLSAVLSSFFPTIRYHRQR